MFGICIHPTKSILFPTDKLTFLGLDVAAKGILSVSDDRRNKIRSVAKRLLGLHNLHRRFVPFTLLRKFLGMAVSIFDVN
jgi:hypothetical protein